MRINVIRRWLCILIIAALLPGPFSIALAESGAEAPAEAASTYSYDFNLHFQINPDDFPSRKKARIRGYAELLDMLDFQGTIIWNQETQSVDLTVSIIPITSPSAALSFHLYGIPSILYLESPLLGNQTVYFHNEVLMEFAYKVWDNLGIKLQYPALLYPFSTTYAFSGIQKAWQKKVKDFKKSGSVSYKSLTSIATSWAKSLESDHALKYWITDLAAPLSCEALVRSEFENLPNYLTKQVANKQALTVKVKNNTVTWRNSEKKTLFKKTTGDDGVEWALTLPATENNYVPSLSFSQKTAEDRMDFTLAGSYVRDKESEAIDSEALPATLLTISAEGASLPTRWPLAGNFSMSASVTGALLPNFSVQITGTGSERGALSLKLSEPLKPDESPVQLLSCLGTLTPSPEKPAVDYREDRTAQATGLFFMNDVSLQELVRKIIRPCVTGILDFIDVAPVSACQSIMDSLTDSGLLDLVLKE